MCARTSNPPSCPTTLICPFLFRRNKGLSLRSCQEDHISIQEQTLPCFLFPHHLRCLRDPLESQGNNNPPIRTAQVTASCKSQESSNQRIDKDPTCRPPNRLDSRRWYRVSQTTKPRSSLHHASRRIATPRSSLPLSSFTCTPQESRQHTFGRRATEQAHHARICAADQHQPFGQEAYRPLLPSSRTGTISSLPLRNLCCRIRIYVYSSVVSSPL